MQTANNSLVRQGRTSFTAYMQNDAVKNQINNVLGGERGMRFISAIVTAVNTNAQLQECSNPSIVSGALLGESLNLSPSPQLGHYYLVPFNDRQKGKVAQFIIGYKGLTQLAIRSGYYKRLNVAAIKEGELVRFDPVEETIELNLIEDEDVRENTPTVGYYAFFEYTNGFKKAIYWSKKKMEKHALQYSKGYQAKKGYTFWEKDFDAMAYKTMLRQLISKWGIMSIDMQKAYESDMAVIKEDGTPEYVDNAALEEETISEPRVVEAEPGEEEKADANEAPNPAMAVLFSGEEK